MPFRKHGWMRPFQRRKRLFGDVIDGEFEVGAERSPGRAGQGELFTARYGPATGAVAGADGRKRAPPASARF